VVDMGLGLWGGLCFEDGEGLLMMKSSGRGE